MAVEMIVDNTGKIDVSQGHQSGYIAPDNLFSIYVAPLSMGLLTESIVRW